jgi:hypothetical protein
MNAADFRFAAAQWAEAKDVGIIRRQHHPVPLTKEMRRAHFIPEDHDLWKVFPLIGIQPFICRAP